MRKEDDLDLFLNGPNFMRSEITSYAVHKYDFFYKLLTRRYIFQLMKYEHKGASESIDSKDRNFSSVGLVK